MRERGNDERRVWSRFAEGEGESCRFNILKGDYFCRAVPRIPVISLLSQTLRQFQRPSPPSVYLSIYLFISWDAPPNYKRRWINARRASSSDNSLLDYTKVAYHGHVSAQRYLAMRTGGVSGHHNGRSCYNRVNIEWSDETLNPLFPT